MGRSILALESARVQLKWADAQGAFGISLLTVHALRKGDHAQLHGGDIG